MATGEGSVFCWGDAVIPLLGLVLVRDWPRGLNLPPSALPEGPTSPLAPGGKIDVDFGTPPGRGFGILLGGPMGPRLAA